VEYPADKFVSRVKRKLGDAFTVRWEKESTDKYKILVFANETGQSWSRTMMYDDFRTINPEVICDAAFSDLEKQMHEYVNKTTDR